MRIPEYPKIPHLPWKPNVSEDDIIASESESSKIFSGDPVIIEEKMDGSGVWIVYQNGNFRIGNRKHEFRKGFLGKNPSTIQYRPIWNWVYHYRHLFEKLNSIDPFTDDDPAIVYGEWMYMAHGIQYDKLTNLFFPFALMDSHRKRFVPHNEMRDIIARSGFSRIPLLYKGCITDYGILEDLCNDDSPFISSGDRRREGIIVRCGDDIFKMVRKDFKPGRYFGDILIKNETK